MIRIILASIFTIAIVGALEHLIPEGNWIYLAELVAGVTGMNFLFILTKEI